MAQRALHLNKAWRELHEDFYSGKYTPLNESDVQSYLFHLLAMERSKDSRRIDLHTEVRDRQGLFADLVYGENEHHRLVVEIKMTKLLKSSDIGKKSKRKIEDDLKKCCNRISIRRRYILLFCFTGKKNREISPCRLGKKDLGRTLRELGGLKRNLESKYHETVVLLPHLELGVGNR